MAASAKVKPKNILAVGPIILENPTLTVFPP